MYRVFCLGVYLPLKLMCIFVSLSYSWKELIIPMQKLCSGDWDRTLKFSVYDWNKLVVHKSLPFTFIICTNLVLYKFCIAIF